MSVLLLPHTLDLYTPGVGGGSPTLIQASVAGYFELLSADTRVRLKAVSNNALARLWLDGTVQDVLVDGMLVYWQERATWWTVHGTPQIFDGTGAAHIEVIVAANRADSFFASPPA